jgi:hypothetical protein
MVLVKLAASSAQWTARSIVIRIEDTIFDKKYWQYHAV